MQTTANVSESGDNRLKRQVQKRVALPMEPGIKIGDAVRKPRRRADLADTFRQMQRGK